MPPVKTFGERIADALVEDGLLTAKQVEELLEQQKKEGTRLLKLILEKAYVSEQDMAVSMGRVLNMPPINLARISIPLEIADLLPRETAHNSTRSSPSRAWRTNCSWRWPTRSTSWPSTTSGASPSWRSPR